MTCYHPANRHERQLTWSEANPQGRWRAFHYDELAAREIMEDLKAALAQFAGIVEDLNGEAEG